MKLQIAIAANGDIHIWTGHDMPPAANLVDLELTRDGSMWVIPADRTVPVRELLGTGEVRGQEVIRDTRRIERILQMTEVLAQDVQAGLDGYEDGDEDEPRPPGF